MTTRIGPPREHVLSEELDAEVVLYDAEAKKYYELNATAGDVWRLATGEFTLDEIVDRLARAYGVDAAAIRPDVEAIVSAWQEAGLLA